MLNPAPMALYAILLMIGIDTIVLDGFRFPAIGGITIIIGIWSVVDSARTLRNHFANVNPDNPATNLVTVRLFGLSRNPMYLGLLVFVTGFAIVTGTIACFIVPVVYGIYLHCRFVIPENREMLNTFPEYRIYANRVRAWL